MSISVTGYTEAKIEGKWYCIDFFQYDMNGHVHHIPCVEGQSIVHTALQWECDMDRIGVPTDLSPQVKAECTGRDGKLFGEDDPHWNPWHMVRGSWFGSVDLDQPEHCGYFPRQAVADYLSNPHDVTLDEGDMIPVEEYRELPEEEKKAYQYYEYTSPYGNRCLRLSSIAQLPCTDNNNFFLTTSFRPRERDFFSAASIKIGNAADNDRAGHIRNTGRCPDSLEDVAASLFKVFHFTGLEVCCRHGKTSRRIIQSGFVQRMLP